MGSRTENCELEIHDRILCADDVQDVSDAQYGSFRGNIPYLAVLLFLHPILRLVSELFKPVLNRKRPNQANGDSTYVSAADGEARLEQRASFDFGFALIFLLALHGISAVKVIGILYINFLLATRLPRRFVPAATWIFNIATLFANELSEGYRLTKMAAYLAPAEAGTTLLHDWAEWLDSYGGIMSRWEILFNITVLRLISFNLDHYWSFDRKAGDPIEVRSTVCFGDGLLIPSRRSSSTVQIFQSVIVLQHPPQRRTTTLGTM